jgi:MFS family permease
MAYAVLVVSALLFELALNLPVGTMPLALTQDGASVPVVAMAMGCGMFAALFVSLPIGALADRIGRLVLIRIAAFVGVGSLLGLAFAHGPLAGGLLLGVRSIALVAYMTAEFAYASELASKERAVSSVATLGMIGNIAFATGPALSVFLWQHGVGREQYGYATGLALLGAACLFALPKRYDERAHGAKRAPIVMHPRWLPAMGFAFACTLQGGVNGALAVLTFHERGIVNGAAIFSASALTAFALRYPAGRLVDRFGPRAVAIPTVVFQAVGCLLAAGAHSLEAVIVAGVFLGVAWSAVVPVALGLLFEHSSNRTRGAAMGSYNLAFCSGAAVGALVAALASVGGPGYSLAIAVCALAPLGVLPYVLRSPVRGQRKIVRGRHALSGAGG